MTLAATVAAGLFSVAPASAATLKTLYTFTGGTDGAFPVGGLVAGPNGVLYGTTVLAGNSADCGGTGCGTIFQLTPPTGGNSAWTFQVIYTFTGDLDGQQPVNMVLGPDKALYGVAEYGGYSGCEIDGELIGCGQVFRLTPQSGGAWQFTTLHEFSGGADGAFPAYGVAVDAKLQVYGFALGGGTCATNNCGTAFVLKKSGGLYKLNVIHAFTGGKDGNAPYAAPILDSAGNVYGTASAGGKNEAACTPDSGCGTVMEFSPKGKNGWTSKVLWSFNGANGTYPLGNLMAGSSGEFYGVTNFGGDMTACPKTSSLPGGCGVVYQLNPPAAGSKKWTQNVLWQYTASTDGLYPNAGPLAYNNYMYVTSSGNGTQGFGSIVKFTPPSGGNSKWQTQSMYDFQNKTDGAQPTDTLVVSGNMLYGTTLGHDGPAPGHYGTVFSVTP